VYQLIKEKFNKREKEKNIEKGRRRGWSCGNKSSEARTSSKKEEKD
jgi:hypothetical protein